MDPEFQAKMRSFFDGCKAIVLKSEASFILEWIPLRINSKFIRIESVRSQQSIWCFVAIADGNNKALGEWKRGDVFKPAGWNAPAKHARGNIFDDKNGLGRIKWTGPEYLH